VEVNNFKKLLAINPGFKKVLSEKVVNYKDSKFRLIFLMLRNVPHLRSLRIEDIKQILFYFHEEQMAPE
jgi:hypothetical protein